MSHRERGSSVRLVKISSTVAASVLIMPLTGCDALPWLTDDRVGVVERIVDGDTLDATVRGASVRIRLLNVDTPETVDPNRPVECLGKEATEFLQRRLPVGAKIKLEYDVERLDKFHRTLAGVYESDKLVNAEIAEAGLGVPLLVEPNRKFWQRVSDAYASAEASGRGLFDPKAACTLPAELSAAEDRLSQQQPPTPRTSAEAEAALASWGTVVAEAEETLRRLDERSRFATSEGGNAYMHYWNAARPRLEQHVERLHQAEQTLSDRHVELAAQELAQRAEAERQAEAARQAAQKAADQAAAQRAAAEKAAAEKAAAEKAAAEKAAADRRAREEAEREEARRAESRAAERAAEERRQAERRAAQEAESASSSSASSRKSTSTSRSTSSGSQYPYARNEAPPGYNGPRCFAPGGQRWKPC